MPSLRKNLSDNFEGSSFVWKNFKNNPALSILGLPFLLLDVALLPIRAIANRKEVRADHSLYRRVGKDGRDESLLNRYLRGIERYVQKTGNEDHDPFGYEDQQRAQLQAFVYEWNGQRKQKQKRKRPKSKVEYRSVIYPGWRLPHNGFAARPTATSRSRHGREQPRGHDPTYERHGRNYRNVLGTSRDPEWCPQTSRSGRMSEHRPNLRSLGEQPSSQYHNPPLNLNGFRMPPQAGPEPYPEHYAQAPQAQPMQGDFTQAAEQHPYGIPGNGNFAPSPGSYVAPTVLTNESNPHSRHSGSTQPNHESYISQSVRSPGSRASGSTQGTWRKPPSTVRTHPQFKPTYREDSVALWDSVSQAPSRMSESTATIRASERGSRSSRASRSGVIPVPQPGDGPPPRSPSISTINTADLPDYIPDSSRSRSTASRAQSYRTAAGAQQAMDPWEEVEGEEDADDSSSSYCTTCDGPHDEGEDGSATASGIFSHPASQPGDGYWQPHPDQQQQGPYAHPMQGHPPGMQQYPQQTSFAGQPPGTQEWQGEPRQASYYGGRSRQPSSRSNGM